MSNNDQARFVPLEEAATMLSTLSVVEDITAHPTRVTQLLTEEGPVWLVIPPLGDAVVLPIASRDERA